MLQRAGGHYIVGEKLRSGKPATEEALSTASRYRAVRNNLEVKRLSLVTAKRAKICSGQEPEAGSRRQRAARKYTGPVKGRIDPGQCYERDLPQQVLLPPTYSPYLRPVLENAKKRRG